MPTVAYRERARRPMSEMSASLGHGLLSADETMTLILEAQGGDIKARNRLVACNVRLAADTARRFRHLARSMDVADLTEHGIIGLIRSIEMFDPDRFTGRQFSTYAALWIKQAIRRAIIDTDGMIGIPAYAMNRACRTGRGIKLAAILGREPSKAEAENVAQARKVMDAVVFSDSCRHVHSDGYVIPKMDPADVSHLCDPAEAVETRDAIAVVLSRVGELPGCEREVLTMRYGLDGSEPMTRADIGRRYGRSRGWAVNIEGRAIGRIREMIGVGIGGGG